MEKTKKQVIPCGYLHDPHANNYYLLSPHPIPWDSWQTDGRQAWQCVKMESGWDDGADDFVYAPTGGQVTVICSTQSTVELCTVDPIEIDAYTWEDVENALDEEERQQLRFDMESVFPPV